MLGFIGLVFTLVGLLKPPANAVAMRLIHIKDFERMSYNIPLPVNESRWQYQTASGGGLTVVMVAGSGGSITLRSPLGKTSATAMVASA